jgi:hypothetical protein
MAAVTSSQNRVQQESIQFNQPVSESSITSVAALANYLRDSIAPVGSIAHSMLTEAQFNAQVGASPNTWFLADGRSAAGTLYASVTGATNVPDLRGVYIRGKNNGRSGSTGNPDGDLALGTYQADQFGSHNHNFSDPGHIHQMNPPFGSAGNIYDGGSDRSAVDNAPFGSGNVTAAATTGITFNTQGGNETRPRTVTVNIFIRVN